MNFYGGMYGSGCYATERFCEGTYSFLSMLKVAFSSLFARFWKGFWFIGLKIARRAKGGEKLKKEKINKNYLYIICTFSNLPLQLVEINHSQYSLEFIPIMLRSLDQILFISVLYLINFILSKL